MNTGRPTGRPVFVLSVLFVGACFRFSCRGGLYGRSDRVPIPAKVRWFHRRRGALYMRPCRTAGITGPASDIAGLPGRIYNPPLSVSKKSFRHAVRIFKLSKKFKNTCRLNAKGAFCPLHTSPAALSQTSSARFFDSLQGGYIIRPYDVCVRRWCIRHGRPQPGPDFCRVRWFNGRTSGLRRTWSGGCREFCRGCRSSASRRPDWRRWCVRSRFPGGPGRTGPPESGPPAR